MRKRHEIRSILGLGTDITSHDTSLTDSDLISNLLTYSLIVRSTKLDSCDGYPETSLGKLGCWVRT